MKLYSVRLWDNNLKEEKTKFVFANNESEAEWESLKNEYLSYSEAEEVNEIQGYKVILEKID